MLFLNPSSLDRWEIVEYLGTATVIAGVVGEVLADFKYFPKNAENRDRFAKVSALVLIAGLAVELLGLVRTSQLFNLEVARLNFEAENARRATAELQGKISARFLSLEQQHAISAAVAQFSLKPDSVWIRSYPNDEEGASLAHQIVVSLGEAGMSVEDRSGDLINPNVIGIQISCGQEQREFAQFLVSTLPRRAVSAFSRSHRSVVRRVRQKFWLGRSRRRNEAGGLPFAIFKGWVRSSS